METNLVERSFSVQLKCLQFLGFFPPQKHKLIYRIYSLMVYCCFTTLVPLLALFYLLFEQNIDLATVSENAFLLCQVGCFILKFLPLMMRNEKRVKEIINSIESPVFCRYTKNQAKIIDECVDTCRRNFHLFYFFCFVSYVTWWTTPFFGKELRFPVEIWLPFDAKATPARFCLTCAYISLGVANSAFTTGALDPLVSGLIYHATGQLRLLKDNLQHLSEYAEEEISKVQKTEIDKSLRNQLKNQIIYEKIGLSIEHHNAVLAFVKDFEEVFASIPFVQFVTSVIVICVTCLQITLTEPFTYTFFAMIIFLITMLTQIFFYSYYGTTLFEESDSLIRAIYIGKWYEYDLKSKRALIVLMECSQKPVVLRAGKILDLSLVTFTTIIRRAYSLLAVLENY